MGIEIKKRHSLYLRLPVKIVDEEQILSLHPNITHVRLPRQKSRRWCTVDFENRQELETVFKDLKKTKVEGKKIVVKDLKRKPKEPSKHTTELF